MTKQIITTSLAILLMASTIPAKAFDDVPRISHYYEAITYFKQRDYIQGRSQYIFAPHGTVTRAEFLKILFAALDIDQRVTSFRNFPDLDTQHWSFQPMILAYAMGIINGHPDGNIYPNGNITYSESLKVVNNILGIPYDERKTWEDAFNYDFLSQIAFTPNQVLTRGQAVRLIYQTFIKDKPVYEQAPQNNYVGQAVLISNNNVLRKTITQKESDVALTSLSITNNSSIPITLEKIEDSNPVFGISNIKANKKAPFKPAFNVEVSRRDSDFIFRDVEILPQATINLSITADIDPTGLSQKFRLANSLLHFTSQNGKFNIRHNGGGNEIILQDQGQAISDFSIKEEDIALFPQKKKLFYSFQLEPSREDLILDEVGITINTDADTYPRILDKISLLDAFGNEIAFSYAIPANSTSSDMTLTNIAATLYKDTQTRFYIAGDLSEKSQAGKKLKVTLAPNSIVTKGMKSGQIISNNSIQLKSSDESTMMLTSAYPEISIDPLSPEILSNSTNTLLSFNIKNPGTDSNLFMQAIRFDMQINNGGRQEALTFSDSYITNNGKRVATCAPFQGQTSLICNFTIPNSNETQAKYLSSNNSNGFEIEKGDSQKLKLISTIANYEFGKDAIKVLINQAGNHKSDITEMQNNTYNINLEDTVISKNYTNSTSLIYKTKEEDKALYFVPLSNIYLSSPLLF